MEKFKLNKYNKPISLTMGSRRYVAKHWDISFLKSIELYPL